MNKLVFISLFAATALSAQTPARVNLWKDGSNPAGIRHLQQGNASSASFYGGYEAGGFRSYSQASSSWKAGAEAETLVHLDRYSMEGGFSFEQFQGREMRGSMAMDQGRWPVDLIEFTPGTKTRQTYGFDGAVSVDMDEHWRLGAGMDFLSANLAKRKDLRHMNYSLDMTVSPGVVWHSGRFSAGLCYILRRESESIKAEQVGMAQPSYNAFIDKGLAYGKEELWEGSGLHLKEAGVSGFPLSSVSNGAALQVSWDRFFAEVRYEHSEGKAGEKQQVWFRFMDNGLHAVLGCELNTPSASHVFRLEASSVGSANDETVLERVNENGVSTYVERGANLVYGSHVMTVAPSYCLRAGQFRLEAGVNASVVEQKAFPFYPYYAEQRSTVYEAAALVSRSFGRLGVSLGLSYGGGDWSFDEGVVTGNSGVATTPMRLQDYWLDKMEYEAASRFEFSPELSWNLGRGLYLRASAFMIKAFGLSCISGDTRSGAEISIDYKF